MIAATQDAEPEEFVLPDGVVTREVCAESHYLALPSCPERKQEVFLRGQVPSQRCFLHGDTFDIRMPDRWSSGGGGN
jgi:hypothetical protein